MQRYLNTLYVTTQKTYLHKKGDAIEVKVDDKTVASIPMINIDSIVCFGNIYVSPFLLGAAPEHNITISFLSETGEFLARVQGPVAGNVLLRKAQYRISDDKEKSAQSRKIFHHRENREPEDCFAESNPRPQRKSRCRKNSICNQHPEPKP